MGCLKILAKADALNVRSKWVCSKSCFDIVDKELEQLAKTLA